MNICEQCILVKGFNADVDSQTLRQIFPEAIRFEPVGSTTSQVPRDREWLIMLQNVQDVKKFINDVRVWKHSEGTLDFSACQPRDIPEEWSKEGGQGSLNKDQPPPYSPYKDMSGGQQTAAFPGNPQQQNFDPQDHYQYHPYMQYPVHGQQGMFPQGPYGAHGNFQNPQGKDGGQQNSGNSQPPPDQWGWAQHPYYPYPSHHQYGGYPHGFGPNQPPGHSGFPHPDMPQGPSFPGQGPGFPETSHTTFQPSSQPSLQEPQTSTNDKNVKQDMEDETTMKTTNMLKVTKLPKGTSEDALSLFFENTRKYGGGEVEKVEADEQTNSAIITFLEDEAVNTVLNKMPIMFNKKVVEVAAYYPKDGAYSDEMSDLPCCTIEVKGMKETTSEDTIVLYFESKKVTNADVTKIEFVEDEKMYLVTFEDEEAVDSAMRKPSHKVDGAELQVDRYVPRNHQNEKGLEIPCCTIEVKGMKDTTSEDTIMYYFESKKGAKADVIEIEFIEEENMYLLSFENEEAVDTVLSKSTHKVDGAVLQVDRHVPRNRRKEKPLKEDPEMPCCTIEVKGMNDTTSEDTIMYYFESKKGAKADVTKIEFIEDKDMYLVTFEDEKAVETVMSKTPHKVDGAELQIKKHIPPKRYHNKTLVKGLSSSISKDSIINYLEARTKVDVEDVEYGSEDSSKAIVTFTDPIDIGTIQSACQKKQLENCNMRFQPVYVTNCIVVRGYSEDTQQSALEFYFDNKRKSGVEGIEKIEMNEDEEYCVIYFEEAENALKACQKTHTLGGCKLKVQVFYDCLGVPADSDGPKFKPLPQLVLKDKEKYKVNFVANSKTSKEALEKQLLKLYCKISFPLSKTESNIIAECILTKNVPQFSKLAKTWEVDVKKEINYFLNQLRTEKYSTLQEAWKLVMDHLRQINIENPDGVSVSIEKPPRCEIVIVGYDIPVRDLSKRVKQIIDNITEDLDRQKKTVNEEVHLKHFQLLILSFSRFPDKIRQTFDKMEIKIELKKLVIKFTGLSKNVNDAKVTMYETIHQIASAPIGKKSPGFIQFLKRSEVKTIISNEIKKSGIVGVWDIQNNFITMYSLSDEEAVSVAGILKSHIIESPVHIDKFQKSVLMTSKWKQHVDSLKNEYEKQSIMVDIETNKQGEITVYCTSKGAEGVLKEKINDFFLYNTETDTTIDLPVDELKFLQEQMSHELDNLQKDLKQRHITMVVKSDCIVVKGNAQGIKDAEAEVDQLVSNIYKTKYSMDKPGLKDLVESPDGKSQLKQVNQKAGVVVSLAREGSKPGFKNRLPADIDGGKTFTAAGGQKVTVVKVDITSLDVDVIVNAANEGLIHSGGLAKALISKGGSSIQDECNQYTKSHGKLSVGECYCSGPGNLKCQIIVHTVGPVWQGGSSGEENELCLCVENALDEAENSGLISMAIPALCTGIFSYPAEKATSAIVRTVRDYFQSNPSSCVKMVYLCDVNPKAVTGFEKAGNKFFGGAAVTSFDIRQASGDNSKHGSIAEGNITIKIIKGELSKMKVDVIVNTTSQDLKLQNGAVSASLLRAAGNAIQDECTKNYPRGVQCGEVAVTSAYNLMCKYVCHGYLESWKPDGSSSKNLEKFTQECLSTASSKKCKSIAFPAMGTGKLNYPKDLVAKHMYIAVKQFASQNPTSGITEVQFVLYNKDYGTVKAFEEEESRLHSTKSEPKGLPTEYTGRKSGKENKKANQAVNLDKKPAADASYDKNEYSVNLGHLEFKVYQGDLTAIKVDAIVNGTNEDLDFSRGAVARAIQRKGGKELEAQLSKEKAEIKKNGIAVTTHKTGLLCKTVFHINMEGADANKVKDKVKLVLDKAEELKIPSVAFPALGTSAAANIPVKRSAEEMFKEVEKFNKNKTGNLKEVHVVIFQNDMLKNFVGAIQDCTKMEKSYFQQFLGWAAGLSGATDGKSVKASRKNRSLSKAQVPVDKKPSFRVDFTIYASDKQAADQAIVLLDKMVDDVFIEKTVGAKIIKEFNVDQLKDVQKKLNEGGRVEFQVDTNVGEIRVKGMKHYVSDAVGLVNEIISDVEREKQMRQRAKLVTDIVQWYYMDKDDKGNDKLVEYPSDVNLILESAVKDQKKNVSFNDADGFEYIIDLDDYVEFPADDPTDKVKVLRKSKLVDQTFVPPVTWDSMDEAENLKIVELKPTDNEFTDVTSKFQSTIGGAKVDFLKIERVQNKTLYQQFIAKKKLMDDTNPPGMKNERPLWHGFSEDAKNSICSYGFNRSYCGKNATAFGKGVYFAVNVAYSIQDTYSRPDSLGIKRMFLCRVLTGEFCNGNGNMRVPPQKPSAAGSHILYDTVTNDSNNPIMFIIFHDSQAYPEYMITFKRK